MLCFCDLDRKFCFLFVHDTTCFLFVHRYFLICKGYRSINQTVPRVTILYFKDEEMAVVAYAEVAL
jgi:hypothetical protein